MARARPLEGADLGAIETPCYVCDLRRLDENLAVLGGVQEAAECKILLALKGFAMWGIFDRISAVLAGVSASAVAEARLGREHFGREVHACAPAYSDADFDALLPLCDHIVFNSQVQLHRLRPRAGDWTGEFGLRLNPEHSEVSVALYDPCAPGSRLGVTRGALDPARLEGLSGLHFHTLCELGADALERTVAAVERRFGDLLGDMRWVNMGGGHHITRADYDVKALVALVRSFRERYGVDVYLEPGEAIALGTGVLVASVLDVVRSGEVDVAILDTSATAHMPDVLEMPYRPDVRGASEPGTLSHTFRLAGLTCLAGDVVGDYSFERPLRIGDRVVFEDMMHYTMVKNTTFNGVRLPSIAVYDGDRVTVLRRFDYADYASRLS